jgi:ATP-dependent Clp protease ATP-binding subunit ClpA
VRAEWPLRGRDRELSQLVAALSTRGAVLVGPAGVGKTRLAVVDDAHEGSAALVHPAGWP